MRNLIAATALSVALLAVAGPSPVFAAEMQPGLWRFTQTSQGARGKARTTRVSRCVRPAEAADPVAYFVPRSRGTCELLSNTMFGSRISARMRCTTGQATTDIASNISFESPVKMAISATYTTSAGGKNAQASMRGEGMRTGNCR